MQLNAVADGKIHADLVQVLCGVMFQPVYTFQDKARAWADLLRTDLFRASISSSFVPHGFRVTLDEAESEARITHKDHDRWHTRVTRSEVFFHADRPSSEFVSEMIDMQAEILRIVLSRLDIEYITTIGAKFILRVPFSIADPAVWTRDVLTLHPAPSLVKDLADLEELAFRLSYTASLGTIALQVSCDPAQKDAIVDFDYFNRDASLWRSEPRQFLTEAYGHLSGRVLSFLQPLVPGGAEIVMD